MVNGKNLGPQRANSILNLQVTYSEQLPLPASKKLSPFGKWQPIYSSVSIHLVRKKNIYEETEKSSIFKPLFHP